MFVRPDYKLNTKVRRPRGRFRILGAAAVLAATFGAVRFFDLDANTADRFISDTQAAPLLSVPLALPGILTGTIIGMARALGESAPLLMIGMVAFIVDVPGSLTDPATALPVQIFLWADSPERAFAERTSAAIIVLLGFLILMNLAAVILRKRLERKW